MAVQYADDTEVTSEFKRVNFGATGAVVETAEVNRFIDEASSFIDVHLRGIYELPLVDADNILLMKKICIDAVSCRIVKILNTKKSKPLSDKRLEQTADECAAWAASKELIIKIHEERLKLLGEVLIASTRRLTFFPKPAACPVFDKDKQQW